MFGAEEFFGEHVSETIQKDAGNSVHDDVGGGDDAVNIVARTDNAAYDGYDDDEHQDVAAFKADEVFDGEERKHEKGHSYTKEKVPEPLRKHRREVYRGAQRKQQEQYYHHRERQVFDAIFKVDFKRYLFHPFLREGSNKRQVDFCRKGRVFLPAIYLFV